ncbi:MAG TPA: outer membrane beta-barrel protein [Acidobacteriota bacterium]
MFPLLVYFLFCSFLFSYDGQKGQIFGSIGYSIFDNARDANPNLTNANFGFGLGFRKSAHVGFRGDVNYFGDSRDHIAYPYDINLWDYGGDFIYYFNDSRQQPYVFGGARVLNYHEISDAPSLPGVGEINVNSLGLDFGVGVHGYLSHNISIRPEFRIVYDADLDEHNDVHSYLFNFSAAVAYHW